MQCISTPCDIAKALYYVGLDPFRKRIRPYSLEQAGGDDGPGDNRCDGHGGPVGESRGKTPASTLYATISRSIKDEGKASAFRKSERGKFEVKILAREYLGS